MNGRQYALLISVSLTALVAVMFHIQNSARLIQDISLDLGFMSLHLQQPAPLPIVLWSTLGIGLLLGMILGIASRRGRIRELEGALSRAERSRSTSDDGWS